LEVANHHQERYPLLTTDLPFKRRVKSSACRFNTYNLVKDSTLNLRAEPFNHLAIYQSVRNPLTHGLRIVATMADSTLKSNLTEAMKDAMRAKDKFRLGAIRLALAEIKRVEVDERVELDDERVTAILDKMVKQRRDSIKQFEAADRHELAAVEKDEIVVLQEFLPQPLTEEESETIIKAAIAESGAASMQDMGKVMALVRPQVVGRVDMGAVSAKIKALLV
jgi:uncharacterized protein YqeY